MASHQNVCRPSDRREAGWPVHLHWLIVDVNNTTVYFAKSKGVTTNTLNKFQIPTQITSLFVKDFGQNIFLPDPTSLESQGSEQSPNLMTSFCASPPL